ncbi:MAG: nucleotidyltransferase substrate binding protein [Candidatus Sericytochromatia bacterium]|nr:nucleotidyltransferase substrate binding protein [Candidatus Sericytochromatia bacterium]
MKQDIRWLQRFQHYRQALAQLSEAVMLSKQRPLSKLERQGLIKAFEFTFELAWNSLKDYFVWQGTTGISGSRDAFRAAYKAEMIPSGELWMQMLRSRNQTVHIYDEATADLILSAIIDTYHALFLALEQSLAQRAADVNT